MDFDHGSMNDFLLGLADSFNTWGGPLISLLFFCLMGYVFYWIIVIMPRRIKKMFGRLEIKGYRSVEAENNDLKAALLQVAPVYPIRPRKDQETPPWNIRNAVKRSDRQGTRYIVHVSRLQIDQPGVKQNATSRVTIIFFEQRRLDINGTVHITPKQNPGNNLWKERYEATLITEGYEQELLDGYDMYSPDHSAIPLPGDAGRALVDILPIICRRELFCFQGGINFKFSPEGWGFCPAQVVYKQPDFEMMLDMFEKISSSLK